MRSAFAIALAVFGCWTGAPGPAAGGPDAIEPRASGNDVAAAVAPLLVDAPSLPPGTRVVALRFFEAGYELPARDQRDYRTRFSSRSRYVTWELVLAFDPISRRYPFDVTTRILKAGEPLTEFTNGTWADPGAGSWHAQGWGRAEPGYWTPGSYQVGILVDGILVAAGQFTIGD